jgi:DNA repair exonuclease SbcCD ATPase subunit
MSDEEYTCDPGYCQSLELYDHIKALTEQLEAARADAKEAEAYAEELERDLNICRMAQAVMDNTVAEAVKMLDEQDRKYNRMTNDMIERHAAKLAECEARLGKAIEGLRNIAVVGFSSDPSVNAAIAKQTVMQARTTLAEIESSEAVTPYGLEGEKE